MSDDNPRPTTRSQSQVIPGLLNVPSTDTSGRKSPVRLLTDVDDQVAAFFSNEPQAADMSQHPEVEELRRIAREQQAFNRVQQEQLQQANANVLALTAALQQLSAGGTQLNAANPALAPKKKPDLPPFDKKNVDVWIKRVEATYLLANITEPRDKFAYLQCKFDVSFNPRINTFLYGDVSAEKWEEFLDYLREEYGPTIRQRAQRYIQDFPRNGQRPSQHLALLQEETKDVTIDDIQKEIVLKGIPSHIRQIMGREVDISFQLY